MTQHEDNIRGLIGYFQSSAERVDSLTMAEAASHMLAFRKFFKSFIKENNRKNERTSNVFIDELVANQISDFFKKMELLLLTVPDDPLRDSVTVSREKLRSIHSNSHAALIDAQVATEFLQNKLRTLEATIARDIGNLPSSSS